MPNQRNNPEDPRQSNPAVQEPNAGQGRQPGNRDNENISDDEEE